jgi:anti-sigma factor RsiW
MGDVYRVTPREGGHIEEQLSAYIDGVLSPRERDTMRLHMEGCVECRTAHDSLLLTRSLVRSMPQVAPPRAFTLTQEMVAPARRDSFWSRLLAPRNAPRLATASALSFTLVVAMLVGNLLLYGRSSNAVPGYAEMAGPVDVMSTATVTTGIAAQEELSVSRMTRAVETPGAAMQPPANSQTTGAADAGATAMMAETPLTEVMAGSAPTANTTMKSAATQAVGAHGNMDALATQTADAYFNATDGTLRRVERDGQSGMNPASPRQGAGARDDLTGGDGGGIYLALVGLFLALGVALGAGAMMARRMQR